MGLRPPSPPSPVRLQPPAPPLTFLMAIMSVRMLSNMVSNRGMVRRLWTWDGMGWGVREGRGGGRRKGRPPFPRHPRHHTNPAIITPLPPQAIARAGHQASWPSCIQATTHPGHHASRPSSTQAIMHPGHHASRPPRVHAIMQAGHHASMPSCSRPPHFQVMPGKSGGGGGPRKVRPGVGWVRWWVGGSQEVVCDGRRPHSRP